MDMTLLSISERKINCPCCGVEFDIAESFPGPSVGTMVCPCSAAFNVFKVEENGVLLPRTALRKESAHLPYIEVVTPRPQQVRPPILVEPVSIPAPLSPVEDAYPGPSVAPVEYIQVLEETITPLPKDPPRPPKPLEKKRTWQNLFGLIP